MASSQHKTVAIVGVGRHGRRLLTLLCQSGIDARIRLIDLCETALQEGLSVCAGRYADVQLARTVEEAHGAVDLCIVTTPSAERVAVVIAMIERGCRNFIIEKTFAGSARELSTLIEALDQYGVRAYSGLVHRRMMFWRDVRERLGRCSTDIVLQANLGAVGLVTDGIHLIDLFVYLTGAERLLIESSLSYPQDIPSPRGKRYRDYGGNFTFRADGTRHFLNLAINPSHNAFGAMTLVTGGLIIVSADLYSYLLTTTDDGTAKSHPVYHYGRGWTEWKIERAGKRFDYFDLYVATMRELLGASTEEAELLPPVAEGLPAHWALYETLDRIAASPAHSLP